MSNTLWFFSSTLLPIMQGAKRSAAAKPGWDKGGCSSICHDFLVVVASEELFISVSCFTPAEPRLWEECAYFALKCRVILFAPFNSSASCGKPAWDLFCTQSLCAFPLTHCFSTASSLSRQLNQYDFSWVIKVIKKNKIKVLTTHVRYILNCIILNYFDFLLFLAYQMRCTVINLTHTNNNTCIYGQLQLVAKLTTGYKLSISCSHPMTWKLRLGSKKLRKLVHETGRQFKYLGVSPHWPSNSLLPLVRCKLWGILGEFQKHFGICQGSQFIKEE